MINTAATIFSGGGGADIGLHDAGLDVRWGIEYDDDIASVARHNGLNIRTADVTGTEPPSPVDLLHASPPCFPEGTMILCDDGLKDISEVEVGDRVVTHEGRYQEVTDVMSRETDTIVLEGLGHWGLETTPNHPFLSSEIVRTYPPHEEREAGNYVEQHMHAPTYIPACMLQGKHWLSLREYPNSTAPKIESHGPRSQDFNLDSDEFWKFVGLWVGDGWVRQRDTSPTTSVCAGYHEQQNAKSILDDAEIKHSVEGAKTTVKFRIYSKGLTDWLVSNFNQHAHAKELPTWLLGLTESKRQAFLDGYLFADGCKTNPQTYKDEVFTASTVSSRLGIGLRMLGLSLGYSVSLKRYERSRENAEIEGREVNERPTYQLRFSQTERHSRPIAQYRGGVVRDTLDGHESVTVYDITVAEDHSFVADGMVVHNCPSFSVAKTNAQETDEDVSLARATCRFIREVQPKAFTLENVWGYRKSQSWRLIRKCLSRQGYDWNAWKLNAASYGVPQTRKRMIVAAIRGGPRPTKPQPTHRENPQNGGLFGDELDEWIGWYEAIEDLIPDLPETELANWQKERLPDELVKTKLFGAGGFRDEVVQRDPYAPTFSLTANHNQKDQLRAVLVSADSLQGKAPATRDDNTPSIGIGQNSRSVNAVLVNESSTIEQRPGTDPATSQVATERNSRQRATTQRRVVQMTPRCLARFQSFPDEYSLPDSKSLACRILGNAVPPLLMQRITESVIQDVESA